MTRPLVSVVVCTCNRAGKLAACLNALGNANRQGSGRRELLIVDNNSTDRTRDVVHAFAKAGSIEVRYIFEPEQGSSAARNRGLAETRGELIAITDDDCIVDASWFQEIEKDFSGAAIDMVGGRVELYNKDDRPISIRTSRVMTKFTRLQDTFSLTQGCNVVFRRSVHERIGGFDTRLGPGSRGMAAEDADFIYRAFCAGFAIHYNPEILVFHDHGRRTDAQQRSLLIAYLRGRCAWYAKYVLQGDRSALQLLYWDLAREVQGVLLKAVRGHAVRDEMRYLWEFVRGLVVGFAIFLPGRPRLMGRANAPSAPR
jgi:GT2 family glycosyltransferase